MSERPLYAICIEQLDKDGLRTGKQANGVLSLAELKDPEKIAWLVNFAETQGNIK